MAYEQISSKHDGWHYQTLQFDTSLNDKDNSFFNTDTNIHRVTRKPEFLLFFCCKFSVDPGLI